MSDFLDRLVARAVAPEPAVAPRLPGLFEPVGEAGAAEETAVRTEAGPAVEAVSAAPSLPPIAAEHPRPLPRPLAPPDAMEPPRADLEPRRETARLDVGRPGPGATEAEPPPSAAVSEISIARRATPPASPPQAPTRAPEPVLPTAVPPSGAAEVDSFAPATPIAATLEAASVDSRDRQPTRPASVERIEERKVIETRVREAPTVRDLTPSAQPAGRLPGPEIRPLVESAPPAADPAPQEPTVKVTIGRLEVRAVRQAKAPSRKAPKPPVMNLDEYLQRRAGGGG